MATTICQERTKPIPPSRKRCGNCEGCLHEDCGKCLECIHKKKFGGDGTSRQACLMRRCLILKNAAYKPPTVPRRPKSICMPKKKKRKATGPKMINLFKLPPSPTSNSIHSIPPEVDEIINNPDHLNQVHSSWCFPIQPDNCYPMSAVESFHARSGSKMTAATEVQQQEEQELEEEEKAKAKEEEDNTSQAHSFMAAVIAATPAPASLESAVMAPTPDPPAREAMSKLQAAAVIASDQACSSQSNTTAATSAAVPASQEKATRKLREAATPAPASQQETISNKWQQLMAATSAAAPETSSQEEASVVVVAATPAPASEEAKSKLQQLKQEVATATVTVATTAAAAPDASQEGSVGVAATPAPASEEAKTKLEQLKQEVGHRAATPPEENQEVATASHDNHDTSNEDNEEVADVEEASRDAEDVTDEGEKDSEANADADLDADTAVGAGAGAGVGAGAGAGASAVVANVSESESTMEGEEEEISKELLASLNAPQPKTGRWSINQEILFHYGLKKYGKGKWKEISNLVPNRTPKQIKSHGQKVLLRRAAGEDIFQILKDNQQRLKLLLARDLIEDFTTEEESEPEEKLKGKREEEESDVDMEEVGDIESVSSRSEEGIVVGANSISDSSTPDDDDDDDDDDDEEDDDEGEENLTCYPCTPQAGSSRQVSRTPPNATRDGDDVFFECLPEDSEEFSLSDPIETSNFPSVACLPRAEGASSPPVEEETEAAKEELVSKFFDHPEMAEDKGRLSDYNQLLLQHVELYRAKETDVHHGRGRINLHALGFRCRLCGAAGHKMQYSQSFPGRIDIMDFNLYIIASKHLIGMGDTPSCPFLSAEARSAIKVAQAISKGQTKERGGTGVSEFFKRLVPLWGIQQTRAGMKLKGDVRANEPMGAPSSRRRGREYGVVATKHNKRIKKANPPKQTTKTTKTASVARKPAPAKPQRAPSSVIERALRGPYKGPARVAKHVYTSSSRAARRVATKTRISYSEIEENHKREKRHQGTKAMTGAAVNEISAAFDAHLEHVFSNVAALKTTGLDEEAEVREFPDARLTEETEQAIKSNTLECPNCHFPIPADRFPLFPLADLVLLQKRQEVELCDDCKSHLDSAKDFHVEQRERKLMDPWNPMVFPTPVFRVGGVSEEFMGYFLSLKFRLTASKARMKDFGRIPATGGNGKFQYMVGDKSVSERRWEWQHCKLLQNAPLETRAIEQFALTHVATQLPLGIEGYRIDPGFVMTQKAVVQGPHRDFCGYESLFNEIYNGLTGDITEPDWAKAETNFLPWVLHLPLCKEGMELNYWPETRKNQPPVRIHIPFGTFLLSRVDAVHGGIFGSPGNIRLHIAYTPLAEAIAIKGKELQLGSAMSDKPSDAMIQHHMELGATESGHHQRKLDLLRDDIGEYRDPKGVDDCERSFPIAFEEPTYAQRLAKRNGAVWDSTMMDNISAEHLFVGR